MVDGRQADLGGLGEGGQLVGGGTIDCRCLTGWTLATWRHAKQMELVEEISRWKARRQVEGCGELSRWKGRLPGWLS